MGHNSRLDGNHDNFPSGMREYLDSYGWHFSKKMCEWAISKMRKKNPSTGKSEPIEYMEKDKVAEVLKKYNIQIENDKGYDVSYVFHMARSDFFKSSIADEQHLAMYVKDYLDDSDGYPEIAFTRFYADCIGKGEPIDWSDVL